MTKKKKGIKEKKNSEHRSTGFFSASPYVNSSTCMVRRAVSIMHGSLPFIEQRRNGRPNISVSRIKQFEQSRRIKNARNLVNLISIIVIILIFFSIFLIINIIISRRNISNKRYRMI